MEKNEEFEKERCQLGLYQAYARHICWIATRVRTLGGVFYKDRFSSGLNVFTNLIQTSRRMLFAEDIVFIEELTGEAG